MKRVIKDQNKMKNTMYIVFGVFALALFGITMSNPSYAEEWLIIDDALDAVAQQITSGSWGFEKVEEEKLIQPVENDEGEDKDIVEPEVTSDEEIEEWESEDKENGEENKEVNVDEIVEDKEQTPEDKEEVESWDNNVEESYGVNNENTEIYDEKINGNKEELILENVQDDQKGKELENDILDPLKLQNNNSLTASSQENPYIIYDEENWLITVYSQDLSYWITLQDKNLGATSVGQYWNYYQWWNNEPIDPNNHNDISTSMSAWWWWSDNYSQTNIIRWYDTVNHIAINVENRKWPCPSWYHVPSQWEFSELIRLYANAKQLEDYLIPWENWLYWMRDLEIDELDFNKDLKFVYWWRKIRRYNNFENIWTNGNYWTSTPHTEWGYRFYIKLGKTYIWTNWKDWASILMSVRCFKNNYLTYPKIVTYHPNWWAFSWMEVNEIKKFTYNYSWTEIIPIYNVEIPDRKSNDVSQQSWWMFAWWYTKDWTNGDWWEEFDFETSSENTVYAKWLPFNDLSITMWDITFTLMDRNLWAIKSELNFSEWNYDEDTLWFYYQRWNNHWFRVDWNNWEMANLSTDTNLKDVTNYWPWNYFYNKDFIFNNSSSWHTPTNRNLWWAQQDLDTYRRWPCPKWYHIPKKAEFNSIIEKFNTRKISDEWVEFCNSKNFTSNNFCLASKLLIPLAWYIWSNIKIYSKWSFIGLSSSTTQEYSDNNSRTFYIWNSGIYSNWMSIKSQAHQLRCFKDEIKKIVYETNWWYFNTTPISISTWWWENSRSLTVPKKNDLPNVFWGWYTTKDFEEWTLVTTSNLKSDTDEIKLYAKWDANTFTISFDADNGEVNPENITVTYDSQYPELPVVNKTWYTFLWWYNWEESINSWDIVKIIEDTTLTAKRNINKYKIIFDTDGWNEISPIEKDYNSIINITLPTPTKECNSFSWWNAELPGTMPAHNITLKAKWNYTCSRSSWWGWRKSTPATSEIDKPAETTAEIAIENEHNSATDEEKGISDVDKPSLNEETSKEVISVTQEITEDGTEIEIVVEAVAIKNTNIVATVRTETPVNWTNSSSSSSTTHTKEQVDAYSFAKSNWLTTTSSIEEAKMNTELTRIQMAKMLSNFAINVLWQEPDTEKGVVKFDDVTNKMDKQYDNAVIKAYQLWIMWQNVKNNEFRPNDEVTRAEFASALSRLLYNTEEWEYKWTWKYYIPHIAKLYNEWIINKADPKIKEKRWYVMTMLKRVVE